MIRVVVFLIMVGVLAVGAAWLADRPGEVVVTWEGFRSKTSLMVMAEAVLVAVAVLMAVWSIIRAILRSPAVLARRQRERRGARAYAAISNGLIAVGSGDIDAARKLSADANRLAPGEPLTLLLSAQAAQLSGDRDGAERAFRAMAGRPTPRRSACMACSSKRTAATITKARGPTPRKPQPLHQRWAGPAGRCWKRAARKAIGPVRWRSWNAIAARSTKRAIAASARCC